MAAAAVSADTRPMTKKLSEMTRADWLSRRWIHTTPPGSPEMVFTDAGDFPEEQRQALFDVLAGGPSESALGGVEVRQGPLAPNVDGGFR